MQTELIHKAKDKAPENQPAMKSREWVAALAWTSTPVLVLCWMSRANLNGNPRQAMIACCVAAAVLIATLVGTLVLGAGQN